VYENLSTANAKPKRRKLTTVVVVDFEVFIRDLFWKIVTNVSKEPGGIRFLRNSSSCLPDNTASNSWKQYLILDGNFQDVSSPQTLRPLLYVHNCKSILLHVLFFVRPEIFS
jgi:hypothetical protein